MSYDSTWELEKRTFKKEPPSHGKCRVCGKSNKLFIHQGCGAAHKAARMASKIYQHPVAKRIRPKKSLRQEYDTVAFFRRHD